MKKILNFLECLIYRLRHKPSETFCNGFCPFCEHYEICRYEMEDHYPF